MKFIMELIGKYNFAIFTVLEKGLGSTLSRNFGEIGEIIILNSHTFIGIVLIPSFDTLQHQKVPQ